MPRFTREQIRRRRQVVPAIGPVVVLLLVGGCTRLLVGALRGGDAGAEQARSQSAPYQADDDAMTVGATAADAAAHTQLPRDHELADDEVLGLDVSAHQGEIAWDQVAGDGYSFAYIKATEGSGYTDERFAENWKGARGAGLTPGAYHYFSLCSSGADQARDFLAAAPPDDSALPPALDLEFDGACQERPSTEAAQQEIDAFTTAVEKAWGRRLVIYSSSDWRRQYGLPVTDSRPDWLFSEAGRPQQEDWALWQFRFDGEVSGITGRVDVDVARVEVLREHATIPRGEGALTHAPTPGS